MGRHLTIFGTMHSPSSPSAEQISELEGIKTFMESVWSDLAKI